MRYRKANRAASTPRGRVTQRRAPERSAAARKDPERLVERMPWESLRPVLAGVPAGPDATLGRLRLFALELLRWNQGVSNLVARDDEPRLLERHFVESLASADIINRLGCNKLVDFGSGGGFPAIPLAIAGVGGHWTLIESRRNKTLFLRRAVQELALANVDVITARLETLVQVDTEALHCDALTSRATMKLGPTLELAAAIVRPGGHAILWKGSGLQEELTSSPGVWQASWESPVRHVLADGPNSISVFVRKA